LTRPSGPFNSRDWQRMCHSPPATFCRLAICNNAMHSCLQNNVRRAWFADADVTRDAVYSMLAAQSSPIPSFVVASPLAVAPLSCCSASCRYHLPTHHPVFRMVTTILISRNERASVCEELAIWLATFSACAGMQHAWATARSHLCLVTKDAWTAYWLR